MALPTNNPRIPPPLIGLLCAGLVWLLALYVPGPVFKHSILTGVLILLGVFGVVIEGLSVLSFVQAKTTVNPLRPQRANNLVISGMNRFSRNPMYLGMLLLLGAWTVYWGHPAGILGPIIFVIYITEFQIKPEEAALETVFGDEYAVYKSKVRRWI